MKSKGLLGNIKHNNISIISVPDREESDRGIGHLFEEIIAENFSNLVKEKVTQIQEAKSRKQDELKETHTKTHDKQNGKG